MPSRKKSTPAIETLSLADWNRVLAVNVTGAFLCAKHAAPLLRQTGAGATAWLDGEFQAMSFAPAPLTLRLDDVDAGGAEEGQRQHQHRVGRIDQQAMDAILSLPQVRVLDQAHREEHSLEVQLPFLQHILGRFSLAPFAVGDASPQEVADVLAMTVQMGGGPLLMYAAKALDCYDELSAA